MEIGGLWGSSESWQKHVQDTATLLPQGTMSLTSGGSCLGRGPDFSSSAARMLGAAASWSAPQSPGSFATLLVFASTVLGRCCQGLEQESSLADPAANYAAWSLVAKSLS